VKEAVREAVSMRRRVAANEVDSIDLTRALRLSACLADTPVNRTHILQDFDKRVNEYVKLRKTLEGKLPN